MVVPNYRINIEVLSKFKMCHTISDQELLKLLYDENFPPAGFNCQEFSEDEDDIDEENSTFSGHESKLIRSWKTK